MSIVTSSEDCKNWLTLFFLNRRSHQMMTIIRKYSEVETERTLMLLQSPFHHLISLSLSFFFFFFLSDCKNISKAFKVIVQWFDCTDLWFPSCNPLCFYRNRHILLILYGHHSIIAKVQDAGLEISEIELQSCYYIHFQTNTLGKGMNTLILPVMC